MVKVDFGDLEQEAQEDNFKPPAEGDYKAKLVNIELKEGSNYPYISSQWELLEAPAQGRMVFNNTSLSPKAETVLANYLSALDPDITREELSNSELDINNSMLRRYQGLKAEVRVTHEEYNGETSAKVSHVKERLTDPSAATTGGELAEEPVGGAEDEFDEDIPF